MGKQFAYPPCKLNPVTEKPYTRHKWTMRHQPVARQRGGLVLYYDKIVCERCGFNDPNPTLH